MVGKLTARTVPREGIERSGQEAVRLMDDRRQRSESFPAKHDTDGPASTERLIEEICDSENLKEALKRVRSNKGSPGVDGMTVDELPDYLMKHWPEIRNQLLTGTYQPQPVKRVDIPKPGGGSRKLGIPTVVS